MPRNRYLAILQTLSEHDVEFIVVRGVAAVLNGAPVNTFDLDIVHSTDPENVPELLRALDALNARYRLQPERMLRPAITHLASPGHQLLITDFGPLDVLGAIGKGRSFKDLLPNTVQLEVRPDLRVRVLDLDTLIAVKEEVGDEKDAAVLPILRRTLQEARQSSKRENQVGS